MDDNQKRNNGGNRRHRPHNKSNAQSNYTPPYAADVLAKPLAEIGLGEQTLAVLTAGKLTTVGDVAKRREHEMYRVQSFGKRHLADLTRCLAAIGVAYRPDDRPVATNAAPAAQEAQAPKAERGKSAADKRPNDRPREERGEKPRGEKQRGDRNDQQRAKPKEQNQNKPNNGRDGAQQGKNKGKNRPNKGQFDENLTLDKLFPKPKMERLPRIEMETDRFVKFQHGGKWGFKTKDGVEVIPPIYDEVFNFKEDYACVERKQLFGYINRDNELVIPYRYVCASSFSEGYACVADEEKCGYINKAGEVVVPFKYEAGTAVTNGLAHVKLDGKWGTLTIATNEISWA